MGCRFESYLWSQLNKTLGVNHSALQSSRVLGDCQRFCQQRGLFPENPATIRADPTRIGPRLANAISSIKWKKLRPSHRIVGAKEQVKGLPARRQTAPAVFLV